MTNRLLYNIFVFAGQHESISGLNGLFGFNGAGDNAFIISSVALVEQLPGQFAQWFDE